MAKGYSARRGFTGGAGMMQQQAQMQQKLLKMQQDMAKAQEEVEKTEFTASVGGGAVTAVVTGKKELTKLAIKPDVIDPEDAEMLQDLVISAVNEALRQADDAMNSSMSSLTGGLNIPRPGPVNRDRKAPALHNAGRVLFRCKRTKYSDISRDILTHSTRRCILCM